MLLPVYNAETTILRAVDSILRQEFKDFELLIIDDGSQDCSSHLVRGIRTVESESKKKYHGGINSTQRRT
ncbi:glycosyltransferase family 2 protein [Roseivirga sp. BDSF3-8]|uniref:glycosyltransferase family 2 protein n=1 Tax=Roseivirga sp. BDSF3-8 TaxID=3241598 RepID=UPI00353248A9